MGNYLRLIQGELDKPKSVLWTEDLDPVLPDTPPELDATQAFKMIFERLVEVGSIQPGEKVRLAFSDEEAVRIAKTIINTNHNQQEV